MTEEGKWTALREEKRTRLEEEKKRTRERQNLERLAELEDDEYWKTQRPVRQEATWYRGVARAVGHARSRLPS